MNARGLTSRAYQGWSLTLLAVFWLLTWAPPAYAQRVALLIGNADYQVGPLRNPISDVREMKAALESVGFKVQTALNADQYQMKALVRDFGNMAQGAEVALLYYSGHGTQANGENYLIPVRAIIGKEADYEVEAVSANALMRQITGAHPKAAVVVLDACRDNPFAAKTKGISKGLVRMDSPTGSMIAFATAPNDTAGDEGYYARVLAEQIRTPGLELFDVFRNTSADVVRLTGGRQTPRISEYSITERIYLAGQLTAPASQQPATQGPARIAAPSSAAQSVAVPATASPEPARVGGPASIVIQPGPSTGKDIWTTSVYSNTGRGGGPGGGIDDENLRVGGWADEYRSLMQFDVSSPTLPKQAKSVVLRLYDHSAQGVGTTPMTLLLITEFWDWKAQGTGSDRLRLWWADQPAANRVGATERRPAILPSPQVGAFYDIDVTDIYAFWQANPTKNFGLELRPTSNANHWNIFYSSDYVDKPTLRPKLIITP